MISQAQIDALRALVPVLPDKAYLAGGVAIATTLKHRPSRDLDFFVPESFDPDTLAESIAVRIPQMRITGTAPGTLYLEVGDVPASVIAYRYPLLGQPEMNETLGVRVATLSDLACMKLAAIASRGLARDFWDLYELLRSGVAHGELANALELYAQKYASDDIGHVVRSLAYFADADASPLPTNLSPSEWEVIKRDFELRVRRLP
jgi:hypothetical protein